MIKVDVNFNFTSDTPHFWDRYWDDEMGKVCVDPDFYSPTLKTYQRIIWNKKLPNGEVFNLTEDSKDYLIWKNFKFSSDSIITSFRYQKYRNMIHKVMNYLPNYKAFIEDYTQKSYTIGGEIIFPKQSKSINQSRGCNPHIKDRFDLTLECIRKYYLNENNPLSEVLLMNKEFFDLFINFKGYVDFFYLQDLVSIDYSRVNFLIGNGDFNVSPLPQSVKEYLLWINNQLDFVKKRNNRIKKSLTNGGIYEKSIKSRKISTSR